MIYREFGKTGLMASAIGMGTWNIGNQWGEIDDGTAYATIRTALDEGINLFDVADSYGLPHGLSEERLGKGLAGDRHRSIIVTKYGNYGKRTGQDLSFKTTDIFVEACHASLFRLRTDYVDVALCHYNNLAPEETDIWLEGMTELQKRGLVRYFGISTDNFEVLKRFNKTGKCSVLEIEYSLAVKSPENEILPYCEEHGIGVLIRGPLCKGLLSGKYDRSSTFGDSVRSQWNEGNSGREQFIKSIERLEQIEKVVPRAEMAATALNYVISHSAAPVAIPGAKSPAQITANARAGEKLMDAAIYEKLRAL